jgi:hypothetical protein
MQQSSEPEMPIPALCDGTRGPGSRRLNATDRVMLAVDEALRQIGYPGFQTQTFLWLAGRADVPRLRAALSRLSEAHPVTVARLAQARSGPCWRFRPGARLTLAEADLDASDEITVLGHAGRLLAESHDPAEGDPVRFHLLHRPDGRDVLLLQYSHSLMDNNATPLLLRELSRCARETPAAPALSQAAATDPLWQYLRRHPRARRRAAADSARERLVEALAHRAIVLGRPATRNFGAPFGILTRRLDPQAARALSVRAQRAGGVPSLSMSILASVFRTIHRLAPPGRGDNLAAGIGIDLGLRGPQGPLFENLMSLVPVHAAPDDLADRDALVRSLSRQMREGLAADTDMGLVGLIGLFARRLHRAAWIAEMTMRYSFSTWYAYFGAIDIGETFFGAAVDDVYYAGPCWSPMGITLLVNQFRGCLRFQATYVPESVSEPLANEFLDKVLCDLAG